MAKHSTIAVTTDGVWLSGKIGRRPFAIRISDEDACSPIGVVKPKLSDLRNDRMQGMDGIELSRHRLGSRFLTSEEKRALNSLLAFAATIPDPYKLWQPDSKLNIFIEDVDDESAAYWMDKFMREVWPYV